MRDGFNTARLTSWQKHKIVRQFEDRNVQKDLKPPFTLTPNEMKHGQELILSIQHDCVGRVNKAQQGAAAPEQHPPTGPPSQAPVNTGNVEAQPAAAAQQPQRAGSKGQASQAQAPAGQPSFQLGATSPHGEPKYMNAAKDMNLHIPPKKKAKASQVKQQGPPAAPEAKAQAPKPPAKPMFYCGEADCEAAAVGFPTEEAKQAHVQTEHVQPSQDPRKFFQENLAATLGLDLEGNTLGSQDTQAAGMSATQSKQGQTPSFAPTPMSRGPSMNRSASGAGRPAKGGEAKADAKASARAGSKEVSKPPADAFATIDPAALLADIPGFNSVAGGVFSDPAVFQALTPNDTPDSKDSGVTEATGEPPEVGAGGAELDAADWHVFGSGLLRGAPEVGDVLGDGEVDEWDRAVLLEAMQPAVPDINWDEVNVDFSKPFSLDTSLYSMDPTALG